MSFRGFIPERSPNQEPIILPAFHMVDESNSEEPSNVSGSEADDVNLGDSEAGGPPHVDEDN